MANVLLVEDDENLGFLVQDSLENQGFTVQLCADGAAGLRTFQERSFDICILDVMLPLLDGFSLAGAIRQQNPAVPFLFLTAKAQPNDRIDGLRLGADDYVTKPFRMEELVLRLKAILKRTTPPILPPANGQNASVFFGQSQLHYANLLLSVKGQPVQLTQKEADVLHLLGRHLNSIVKRDTILKDIWEDNGYFVARSLDVFISKLRKYLRPDETLRIANIHGVGYKLEVLPPAPLLK
ncbi:MAG: Two-component transcriptional response regulator, LuxR family [uncultured Adhaeribacter sp.]|uniref:Two-component transcriptional response regulator, LuxR family n=1 Tax=uncultured Adhaeribacter sp. TaxID=448109 RepID=A0A6J4JBS9_9BACT|nr:MAG: Two-component transcriptional response regulator, LuxR family [uncultured Adhaeribacter sp.]